MRNLLHAFVRSLLHNPVPRWINMSGRTGQSVGPPNRGGIKDDVVLRPIVESGAVLAHGFSIDGGIAFRDDAHAGQVHGRGTVPLPSQETFDGVSFLHSRTRKKPMLRHGAGPIARAHAATGLLIFVQSSSHQLSAIRSHVHFKVCDG